jgi:hypothetical protein
MFVSMPRLFFLKAARIGQANAREFDGRAGCVNWTAIPLLN